MEDRLFRNAMGKFATGVTVITTNVNGKIHGMTANAFMSISLNPKLVVISIGEKASMLKHVQQSGTFTVNFFYLPSSKSCQCYLLVKSKKSVM